MEEMGAEAPWVLCFANNDINCYSFSDDDQCEDEV